MIISKENLQLMAQELSGIIGHDINIIEKNGIISASTDKRRIGQIHQGALRIMEEELESLVITREEDGPGARMGVNLPIVVDGQTEGVIGITGEPDTVAVYGGVVKKMAEIMFRDIRRTEADALEERARNIFAESYLSMGEDGVKQLEKNAATLGFDIACSRYIAVMDCHDKKGNPVDELRLIQLVQRYQRRFLRSRQNICMARQGRLVFIMRDEGMSENLSKMRAVIQDLEERQDCRARCGLALLQRGGPQVCYEQAMLALRAARQDEASKLVCYKENTPDMIVQSIPAMIRADLRRQMLSRSTPEEQDMVISTLKLYFAAEGNVDRAASLAYVHRNTIYYRLSQIEKITGCSLKKPGELFLLYVLAHSSKE